MAYTDTGPRVISRRTLRRKINKANLKIEKSGANDHQPSDTAGTPLPRIYFQTGIVQPNSVEPPLNTNLAMGISQRAYSDEGANRNQPPLEPRDIIVQECYVPRAYDYQAEVYNRTSIYSESSNYQKRGDPIVGSTEEQPGQAQLGSVHHNSLQPQYVYRPDPKASRRGRRKRSREYLNQRRSST